MTAAFILLPLSFLSARDVIIYVEDAEMGMPLEGALVHSWDGEVLECGEDGSVRLDAPSGVRVVVRVSYPGYETGRLVIGDEGFEFRVLLRLGGVMENRELVVEAQRPGVSETRTGRSVGISGRDLSRTAEIGVIEDVMTSIKLLPGVGYSGSFNAMPSIRGGFPGDLVASLDGFYIEWPYHWGGVASIFDPRMISRARLSHGVFSSRYGNTISGLLELASRKASSTDTAFELSLSTSATGFNLSQPLGSSGGLMLMGKVTYWDPFVWAAKQVSKEVRMVSVAPYIRSFAFSANYRFSPDLEWTSSGFFGMDGIGVNYEDRANQGDAIGTNSMELDWLNRQGFFMTGFTWNPALDKVVKFQAGAGLRSQNMTGLIRYDLYLMYSSDFWAKWGGTTIPGPSVFPPGYDLDQTQAMHTDDTVINTQGRVDFDWNLGDGFLAAFGVQEMYLQWLKKERFLLWQEDYAGTLVDNSGQSWPYYEAYAVDHTINVHNGGFFTSAYALAEYASDDRGLNVELGLRLDHLYFMGRDFTLQTLPVVNPRLNMDFKILENAGPLDLLGLSLGTGLFSSMNQGVSSLDASNGIKNYEMKQNRSWTSVAGVKLDFAYGYTLTFEAYIKRIFDRAYTYADIQGPALHQFVYKFDGVGLVRGFDVMLQKFESRYWDGWISYSFTHARYRDPQGVETNLMGFSDTRGSSWYYPDFHRFHNLNLVINIKPSRDFNIAARFGFASGSPQNDVGAILSYPVKISGTTTWMEKWKRAERYSDSRRSGFVLPLDLKFSFFSFNPQGKVISEVYLAVENILSLAYKPKSNTTFNSFTGKEEAGSTSANYTLNIPMISFGFRWSY
ncbi:MAG: hypothetical protein LBC67_01185 [Spirochaetales bacterium]|nr:hypothetical protein [Spirochaetales bacterium]